MSNTEALRKALSDLLDHYTALVNSGDAGNWNPETEPPVIAARAALAQQPAASVEPAEPLKGWKLNHAQKGPEDGMAEIGYLDPEDDHFSPIVTVDTGLYYQANQAMPLAVAILGALADAAPQPAPARVPLTEAQVLSAILPIAADNPTVYLALCYESGPYSVTQLRTVAVSLARAIEAAHGIAAPTAQQEPKP